MHDRPAVSRNHTALLIAVGLMLSSHAFGQPDDDEEETKAVSVVGLKIGAVLNDGWYPSEESFVEESGTTPAYGLNALWLKADESGGYGIAVTVEAVSYMNEVFGVSSEITQFTVGAALLYGMVVESTAVYGGLGYASTELEGNFRGIGGAPIGENDHWYATAGAVRGNSKGLALGVDASYLAGGIETVTVNIVIGYRF